MSLRLSESLANSISLPQEGVASFIRKTYELLEEQSHSDIVAWSEDGNYVVIKDLQKFTGRILPVYFKHNKMNSFIRQLNMYNFRKKRTMNSCHVYFNELFKKGKVELLPLIKRKISDTPSSPINSDYQPSQSHSTKGNHDLSYENMMLKKLNQKAVLKISTLEAKIADLVYENKMLFKRINEKRRKEEYLHPNTQVYPSQSFGYMPVSGAYSPYPQAFVKSEVQLVQMPTPDTDDTSSPDTFLSYGEDVITSMESTELQSTNVYDGSANSFSYYEDTSFLGKRPSSHAWEDELNLRYEPVKMQCYGLFEDSEDKRINMFDPEFQNFSANFVDGAF